MPVVNANSVGPDQTPRYAASDLGLQCLPVSHLWDARHKKVKPNYRIWPKYSFRYVCANSADPDQTP